MTAAELDALVKAGASAEMIAAAVRAGLDTEAEPDLFAGPEDRKRGRRIDPHWIPCPEARNFALAKGLNESEIAVEAEKFRNYWEGVSGSKGVKRDWLATWRNWIINRVTRYNGQRTPALRRPQPAGDDFRAGMQAARAAILGDDQPAGRDGEEIPPGRHNIDL